MRSEISITENVQQAEETSYQANTEVLASIVQHDNTRDLHPTLSETHQTAYGHQGRRASTAQSSTTRERPIHIASRGRVYYRMLEEADEAQEYVALHEPHMHAHLLSVISSIPSESEVQNVLSAFGYPALTSRSGRIRIDYMTWIPIRSLVESGQKEQRTPRQHVLAESRSRRMPPENTPDMEVIQEKKKRRNHHPQM